MKLDVIHYKQIACIKDLEVHVYQKLSIFILRCIQVEEATTQVFMIPCLKDLLALIDTSHFVDAATNVDLGVPITSGQLPQLHPFLHQVIIYFLHQAHYEKSNKSINKYT